MTTIETPTKAEAWPAADVEKLLTLWESGLSASRIAAALGGTKSRNAVLGKLHRLGKLDAAPVLPDGEERERPRPPKPPRAQPSMPRVPQRPRLVKPEPEALVIVAPVPARKDGEPITVPSLEAHHCRWPHGDPGTPEFHFCGAPNNGTSSYCQFHADKAFASNEANRNLRRSTREAVVRHAIGRGM
jgi:GcrA cell cycle regulator